MAALHSIEARVAAPSGLLLWAAILAYLALVVGFAWRASPFAETLAAIGVASALAHAIVTLGRRDALILVVLCLVVTFSIENLNAATGFPFGRCHFAVDAGLPRIGAIPIIVGALWFGMGWFSWVVAGALLDERRPSAFAQPLVAAVVMTQWDVVMDPPSATIAKAWVWHEGGAHFGVPLSNYLGWLLTSWIFYQLFALALRRRGDAPAIGRKARLIAILFYAASGLTHLTPLLLGETGVAIDRAGKAWRIQDVREATVAVMLLTMGFTSLLAALRLRLTPASPPDARSAA